MEDKMRALDWAHGLCHAGVKTMIKRLQKRRLLWRGARAACRLYADNCLPCLYSKPKRQRTRVPKPLPWDTSSSTATWAGDFLVMPDVLILGLRSRGSRHLILKAFPINGSSVALAELLWQQFEANPFYSAKLLIFDSETRITPALEERLKAEGIAVVKLTPNTFHNQSIEGTWAWVRPLLTAAAWVKGGWARFRPGLQAFLADLQEEISSTPMQVLHWLTPDEFIALPEDQQLQNLQARKAREEELYAKKLEHVRTDAPYEDGYYLYWHPVADQNKHPDQHLWRGPYRFAVCPNQHHNGCMVREGHHVSVERLKRWTALELPSPSLLAAVSTAVQTAASQDAPHPATTAAACMAAMADDVDDGPAIGAIEADLEDPDAVALAVEYEDIFEVDLSSFIDYPPLKIPWDGKVPKGAFTAGYRLDPNDMSFLSSEFSSFETAGIMFRTYKPGLFAAAAFATKAPTGPHSHRQRTVIDYSPGINQALLPFQYPQPRISDILQRTVGSHWFTLCDYKGAYHQARLDEESQPLLNVRLGNCLFTPKRLMEGVACAVSLFQSMMEDIHSVQLERGSLQIYLDENLISTPTREEHLRELRTFFDTCRRRHIRLSRPKCKLMVQRVQVLGACLYKGTHKPPDTYIRKITEVPRPVSVGELHKYLGMVIWITPHLPDAVVSAHRLYQLFPTDRYRMGKKLEWNPEAIDAWEKMQELLRSPRVLALPDLNRPFSVHVDSSHEHGVGAVLMQADDHGQERPVEFWSRCWKYQWEKDAAPRTLELNGVVQSLQHWAHYIRNGYPIQVSTDHRSLTQSLIPRASDDAHVRNLLASLRGFDVRVTYVKGKDFHGPDWLSRN